jgi:hypothetical protein
MKNRKSLSPVSLPADTDLNMGRSEHKQQQGYLTGAFRIKNIKNRFKTSPILTVNKQQLLLPLYSHMLLA